MYKGNYPDDRYDPDGYHNWEYMSYDYNTRTLTINDNYDCLINTNFTESTVDFFEYNPEKIIFSDGITKYVPPCYFPHNITHVYFGKNYNQEIHIPNIECNISIPLTYNKIIERPYTNVYMYSVDKVNLNFQNIFTVFSKHDIFTEDKSDSEKYIFNIKTDVLKKPITLVGDKLLYMYEDLNEEYNFVSDRIKLAYLKLKNYEIILVNNLQDRYNNIIKYIDEIDTECKNTYANIIKKIGNMEESIKEIVIVKNCSENNCLNSGIGYRPGHGYDYMYGNGYIKEKWNYYCICYRCNHC